MKARITSSTSVPRICDLAPGTLFRYRRPCGEMSLVVYLKLSDPADYQCLRVFCPPGTDTINGGGNFGLADFEDQWTDEAEVIGLLQVTK